ncbi:MAG: phosphodiesterase [Lachnospiraceae bacterium]|nr:phosphodiesterase [Lachnospiraceae bacterium]
MKWMIASDIHGSVPACRTLWEAYDREQADRLLLLGDLFYHGPLGGPPEGYDPRVAADLLNRRAESILCVRGNTESEAVQQVLRFPVMADYALLSDGERLIFATHGHVYGPAKPPLLSRGDILLAGHTHVAALRMLEGGILYMNPGSIALPLGERGPSYMIWEKGRFLWKDTDGSVFEEWCSE